MSNLVNLFYGSQAASWNGSAFECSFDFEVPTGSKFLLMRFGGIRSDFSNLPTYGGVPFQKQDFVGDANGSGAGIYFMYNPPTGVNTFRILVSGNVEYVFDSSIDDIVIRGSNSNGAYSFGSKTTNFTTESGDIVYDVYSTTKTDVTLTPQAGQVADTPQTVATRTSYKVASGTTTTLGWDTTAGTHSAQTGIVLQVSSSEPPQTISDSLEFSATPSDSFSAVVSANTLWQSTSQSFDSLTALVRVFSGIVETAVVEHNRGNSESSSQILSDSSGTASVESLLAQASVTIQEAVDSEEFWTSIASSHYFLENYAVMDDSFISNSFSNDFKKISESSETLSKLYNICHQIVVISTTSTTTSRFLAKVKSSEKFSNLANIVDSIDERIKSNSYNVSTVDVVTVGLVAGYFKRIRISTSLSYTTTIMTPYKVSKIYIK